LERGSQKVGWQVFFPINEYLLRYAASNRQNGGLLSKVWLVTGSASGLGRDIAGAVLASGDRLLATARDPHRLNDLVERYGEQVHTASLDVADEAAAKAAVEKAVEIFRRLDVVVNNAGFGDVAPFERLTKFRELSRSSRHELLRRRLYDASGDPGHAEAEE
jgi:NAD(P)-dependent dehydrogenase (short-subunit alcohol dehydrogenase family)